MNTPKLSTAFTPGQCREGECVPVPAFSLADVPNHQGPVGYSCLACGRTMTDYHQVKQSMLLDHLGRAMPRPRPGPSIVRRFPIVIKHVVHQRAA